MKDFPSVVYDSAPVRSRFGLKLFMVMLLVLILMGGCAISFQHKMIGYLTDRTETLENQVIEVNARITELENRKFDKKQIKKDSHK